MSACFWSPECRCVRTCPWIVQWARMGLGRTSGFDLVGDGHVQVAGGVGGVDSYLSALSRELADLAIAEG